MTVKHFFVTHVMTDQHVSYRHRKQPDAVWQAEKNFETIVIK